MSQINSDYMSNEDLFVLKDCSIENFKEFYNESCYSIIMLDCDATATVDNVRYVLAASTILFLTPLQTIALSSRSCATVRMLQFHGDYYCIEYHKKEVACNGVLFNNIYVAPVVEPNTQESQEVELIMGQLLAYSSSKDDLTTPIIKSYLQVLLAICSRIKQKSKSVCDVKSVSDRVAEDFQALLESHFLKERNPSFYALNLHMEPAYFSRRIKTLLGKTPTKLIQERVILEAKRLLHLTFKTVKEIAHELSFEDEYYFSRYFKREVGVSPLQFREKVGISVVAKKSI